mmetsp:Transcript_17557/g.25628  ORF Transcript_17557/g.25628 Transcript_17557/m.25628 type:complete len:127 (+) Transcript_17557:43-423(+)|eukprot:CAMPEP_0197239090 /NCGR_PEP_ID=MMETSP1429-20130617/5590_1 /TAXON_ID=49237 /ORGANISM="Chaetoceros  sp., Strain UNC1202" /LENGTH=126 /DNA_ID=CAMNT_0042698423 /DNA_START=62 /DNA_END=442 /DNA_ORIENTATION=-
MDVDTQNNPEANHEGEQYQGGICLDGEAAEAQLQEDPAPTSDVETENNSPSQVDRAARTLERNVDRSWRRCCCWSLYLRRASLDDEDAVAMDPPRGIFETMDSIAWLDDDDDDENNDNFDGMLDRI